ncbi:transcription factor IIF subunit tfg1 [Coemansia javaensis]|uniref:Transcription initiation factor IIF subunit alpha n=1 Tax=Coemansia javaensis TaxID=2761396 RepID=A0A9W8H4I1_9FUNG|nr:transcription factor IIF subunit tfg1 [Coemansia javaensis]
MSTGIRQPRKKPGAGRPGPPRVGVAPLPLPLPMPRAPLSQAAPPPPQQQPPPVTTTAAADTRKSTDYTLMAAPRKRTHNVMRFLGERDVDLTTFAPPVKLRRRNREYYRQKNKKRNEERLAQQQQEEQELRAAEAALGLPPKEERPKADINLIADAGGARRNRRNLFRKRTSQIFFANEDRRRMDIEEARPWMLEDDDESELWTGTLEGGQSSSFVLFVLAADGFKVVPVDRWYKFASKLNYKPLTLDEAEEEMLRQRKGNATHDRWLMHRRNQPKPEDGDEEPAEPAAPRQSLVEYEAGLDSDPDDLDDGAPAAKRQAGFGKHGGMDEVEFEMEFDDDEEPGDVRFEFNAEEAAQTKEQREKNHVSIFGSDNEDASDSDDSAAAGDPARSERDKNAKALRKLMRVHEGNKDYDSDKELNPYLSESELESDEDDDADDAAAAAAAAADDDAAKDAEDRPQPPDQQKGASALPPGGQKQQPSMPAPATSLAASAAKKRKRMSAAPAPGGAKAARPSSPPAADARKQLSRPSSASPPPPPPTSSASSSSAPKAAGGASSSTLITKQEIVDIIRSGVSTTKELIGHVRKKLKANPENKSRIHAILKEVATYKNNQLSLKKP